MKPIDFEHKYLLKVNDKNSNIDMNRYVMNNAPCPFLHNERCSIHGSKPFSCCAFPFEIGMEFVQLHGIEFCPTATLIAEEIREFLKKPHLNSKIVWEIRDRSGVKVHSPLEELMDAKNLDDIINPVEDKYKEIGIFELTQQDNSDVYEMIEFLWFLESKGLIGVNEKP
jgi:Fe-S-cluster containining protein